MVCTGLYWSGFTGLITNLSVELGVVVVGVEAVVPIQDSPQGVRVLHHDALLVHQSGGDGSGETPVLVLCSCCSAL